MLETARELLRQSGRIARERRAAVALFQVFVALGCVLMMPHDPARSLQFSSSNKEQPWHGLARWLSYWGSYQTGTVIVAALLWLAGRVRHHTRWQVAALACVLGASLAGIEVNVVRFTAGRARPNAKAPAGWYGPHFDQQYASFPSAHSATAFGTASALAVAMPPVGIPLLAVADGVAWSRLALGRHYPSDVWVGSWVGLLNGAVLGFAARRIARQNSTASIRGQPHRT